MYFKLISWGFSMAINISLGSQNSWTAGPIAAYIDPVTNIALLSNNVFSGTTITSSKGVTVNAIKVISGQPVSTSIYNVAFTFGWGGIQSQTVSLSKAQATPLVLKQAFSSGNTYQEQVIARTNAGKIFYDLIISTNKIVNANSVAADLQQIAQSLQISETGSQANSHVSTYNFSLQVSPNGKTWFGAQSGQNNAVNVTWDDAPPTVTQTLFAGTNVFLKFNSTTGSLAAQGDGENTVNPPVSLFKVTANGVVQSLKSVFIDHNDHVVLGMANALPSNAKVIVSYNAPPQSVTGVLESAYSMNNVASFTTTAAYAPPASVTITVGNSEMPLDFAGPLPLLSLNNYQGSPNTFTLNSYDAKSGVAIVTVKEGIITNPLYQATAKSGLAAEHYLQFYTVVTINVAKSQLNINSVFPSGVNSTITSADFKAHAQSFNYVGNSITSGVNGSVNGVALDKNNYVFYTVSSSAGIALNADARLPAAGGLWGAETISGNTSANETFQAGTANSTITGGSGNNSVVFTNNFADYTFKYAVNNTYSVTNISTSVVNKLTNIQRLVFSDRIISPVGINVALAASAQADVNVDGFTVYDTTANIGSYLTSLFADNKLASISLVDSSKAISINAGQSSFAHVVLDKIVGTYNLIVMGSKEIDTVYDTANSHATLIGGAGIDLFNVTGTDVITDLGNGGADILNIAAGATANVTINTAWIATSATTNNGIANINTAGLVVNLSAVTKGSHGFNVTDTSGAVKLMGSGLADKLIGGKDNDILMGGAGNDTLGGGLGNDTLTGGTGVDVFGFNTVPNKITNLDAITDFVSGTDKLQFSKAVFAKITTVAGAGLGATLTATEFVSSKIATSSATATAHFIYNSTSGGLYYDADGNGKGAAVDIAILGTVTHPALTAADILIVA